MVTGIVAFFFFSVILVICISLFYRRYQKLRAQYDSLYQSFRNLETLNNRLRAARHDFLNHLQVINGLAELDDMDGLKEYLSPLTEKLMLSQKALKTSRPAVNALLMAKMDEAKRKEIPVMTEVKSDLKNIPIEDWELCKILANLIDNAITAQENAVGNENKRFISIDISEDKDHYCFVIANGGPEIPPSLRKEIFREGFTIKKEAGHGMGLAIVSRVLNEAGGSIDIYSVSGHTEFRVKLPKQPCSPQVRRRIL